MCGTSIKRDVNMRVLLTGGTGYIGKHVVSILQNRGVPTLMLGKKPLDHMPSNFQFAECDLLRSSSFDVIQQFKPTHLIHLAWFAKHGEFWTSVENTQWVTSTIDLVEQFAASGGQHLTVSGTCAEYSWDETVCEENVTSICPSTIYGKAKNLTHECLQLLCDSKGLSLAWARVFFPFGGAGEHPNRLFPSLVSALRAGKSIEVNGCLQRDFLHVEDMAAALAHLSLGSKKGVFNMASGETLSIKQFGDLVATHLGKSPDLVVDNRAGAFGQPMIISACVQQLKSTGWSPAMSVIERLATFLSKD